MEELGLVYLRGDGIKSDKKLAASWLRLAEKNGRKGVGQSWIWKEKYL